MIEDLKSASDQLRAALDNYLKVYSNIQNYHSSNEGPDASGFSPEICHHLDTELAFISTYEPKLQEIKVVISGARNYSSGLAPVGALPPEILTRIFHLALARPCELDCIGYNFDLYRRSRNPDYLAQVCSRWRRTAISSGSLWCHIDICADYYLDNSWKRAWLHWRRASEFPIELHIMLYSSDRPQECFDRLYLMIHKLSANVETLHLVVSGDFSDFHGAVLKTLLVNQHPIFRKLVLQSTSNRDNAVVATGPLVPHVNNRLRTFRVDLPEMQIERDFASLTVLHLFGIYPRWSSVAYHGLVDLRLLSAAWRSRITEAEFVTILKSSPQLQILHFGLDLRDMTWDRETVPPISLEDLQVVKIYPARVEWIRHTLCPSSVLRLLAPGSKRLRLSLAGYFEGPLEPIFPPELEAFFERSRVTRFYISRLLPPMSILRRAAHLERVVIDGCSSYAQPTSHSRWLEVDEADSLPSLRSLHITRSFLSKEALHLLANSCPDETVLNSCEVFRGRAPEKVQLEADEMLNVFPTVKTTKYTPYPYADPTADWDILD